MSAALKRATSTSPTALSTASQPTVLRDPKQVARVLSPLRLTLLKALTEPDSASGLARRLDLPRQKVNYHLRILEEHGFVELVEERQKRGCVERCLAVTSQAWLIDPRLLGDLAGRSEVDGDRASSAYLLHAAARTLRDVSLLRDGATAAGKRLTTLTLETRVHFADRGAHRAFSEELAGAVAALVAKYDRPDAAGARAFQTTALMHPARRSDPAGT